jgi:hypothetical protein
VPQNFFKKPVMAETRVAAAVLALLTTTAKAFQRIEPRPDSFGVKLVMEELNRLAIICGIINPPAASS